MKKILLFLMLITCSSTFGADNSDIIWTWGNGKFVASIFSFMYFLLNVDTLNTIIKFSGVIGITVVFFRELAKGSSFQPSALALKMAFFFFITQGTAELFLTVKQDAAHRVYILSANELATPAWQKCRPVNGDDECYAPTGVKLLVSSLTNMERASIGMMESAMMDANALSYSFSRMGLGFGFTFCDQIAKTKGDPFTYNTFMEFYENCIIYDLADGTKSVDGLYKSKDLASYTLSPNSRLTNVYSSANPNGILHTCYEVSSATLWGNINCDKTAKQLQAKASGSSASETTTGDICLAAENFGKLMFNTAKDAGQQIEQRTIMNLTNEAIVNSAIASGIDPSVLAYGTTMADREQTSKWMVMGVMAKEWIPAMRGIMQGIAIGIIWILAVLSIMTASPVQYLGTAVGFQVTLMVWSILLALINYATIDNMAGQLPNIFVTDLGVGDQMTLWSQPTFDEQNQKAMAFLGYMAVASYGIAAGLVKIGGNALSGSFSGMVGALSVGMGTSANAAKGHMDHGLSKVDSGGAQHVSRTGNVDVISASGYEQTQKSQEGHSAYKESVSSKYGGSNDIEKTTNTDGTSAFKASYGNESVTMNGKDGKVTNANLGSAIQASADQAYSHELEKVKGEAASHEQNGNKSISSAINDSSSTAQSMIKSVNEKVGTGAGTDVAKTYNEQTQHNLTEAFKDINGSQETLQKLRSVDFSAGVGFQVAGNGATVTGKSSAQSNDTVSISLSKEEATALSKSMATGLAVTAKTNNNIGADLANGVIQKSDSSLTKTNQAAHAYSEANKLIETASNMEKNKEGVSASLKKDLNVEVAQKIIDNMGFQNGTDALLHDKGLVERTAKQIYQEKIDSMPKVDTDSTFNKAEYGINQSKGSVSPVNGSDPRTANMSEIYNGYQATVNNTSNSNLNNMPDTSNAPTIPTDNYIKNQYDSSKANHDDRGKDLVPNAIPDVIRDNVRTGKDYLDPKIKRSQDH